MPKPNYKQLDRIEYIKTHANNFDAAFKLIWGWIFDCNLTMKETKELFLTSHKLFDILPKYEN